MITLVTVTVIVLFSAFIGSSIAWVVARTLLDALEPARLPQQPIPVSLVRLPAHFD